MAILVLLALFLSLTRYSSASYCICKDGVSDSMLQKTIDYACGAGADCRAILQNGACFNPNTIKSHCDYAANSYFQNKGQASGSCDFTGTAMPSTSLPSTVASACSYPTSPGIMVCITSTSLAFNINGNIKGQIQPSRGLRQGDPISPYLFIICADVFSCLLSKAVKDKQIHGIKISRTAPTISHLFFADDSILFLRSTLEESSKVAEILSAYERASGQKVNMSKSEVVFSKNVDDSRRNQILGRFGMNEVDKYGKYLGLPTMIGRSKKAVFSSLKDRIWKKAQGWKEKLLSKPGKEVLIKAVAQSIPTYTMSVFRLPDTFLDEIQSLLANFWWGSGTRGGGMHWKRWELLCKPKRLGGLGFRDLNVFNQALLAKQGWRLIQSPDSLVARVLKARYFPKSEFVNARRGFAPSYPWRSIWGAKALLVEGLHWRVGNGSSINIWTDRWFPHQSLPPASSTLQATHPDLKVASLINQNSRQWDTEMVARFFDDQETQKHIVSVPLSFFPCDDELFWVPTKDGIFTVKSAYWLGILGTSPDYENDHQDAIHELWIKVWGLETMPKLKHWLWRIINEFVAVYERLTYRRIRANDTCPRCGNGAETVLHVLLDCFISSQIIATTEWSTLLVDAPRTSVVSFFNWIWDRVKGIELLKLLGLLWALWTHRNNGVFERDTSDPQIMVHGFINMVLQYNMTRITTSNKCPTPSTSSFEKWQPPPPNMVKINTDAAVWDNGTVGFGWVIRDQQGKTLAAGALKKNVLWDARIAEHAAARYGVQQAHQLGFLNAIIECDALSVISALHSRKTFRNCIYHFLNDIRCILPNFNSLLASHVKRGGNCVAHFLARLGPDDGSELLYTDNLPQDVLSLAEADL